MALHHATGPTVDEHKFDLKTIDFNQGVVVSGIVDELKKQLAAKTGVLAELGLA